MPCYRPVKAFYGNKTPSGKRQIVFSSGQAQSCIDLSLPCGTCIGCRLERARQWAMRITDESKLYTRNSFITLTFNDENLPLNRSLNHTIFQKFMKRLRKREGDHMIRYFMCGEYGAKTARPHYHAILFNYDFPDRKYFKTTKAGEKIYTSALLDALWGFGYTSVGDVTFGSAAYVARYHVKKVGSIVSNDHYTNYKTGEMLAPEYVRMSRGDHVRGTGGIARGWFEKYKMDVYPHDFRVIKGLDTKPCRYYDHMYELTDSEDYLRIKLARVRSTNKSDNTEERLAVKEEVKKSQISYLKNNLEDIYR